MVSETDEHDHEHVPGGGEMNRVMRPWMWSLILLSGVAVTSPAEAQQPVAPPSPQSGTTAPSASTPDLSGEWDILEVEDNKRYKATLDKHGNGPYSQHGGRFLTTGFANRLWQGTWQQPGNDREGGFEVLLSEDGREAKGAWWYTRVGTRKNIPAREHGGTYLWKRVTPRPDSR
jgi:hypothetical protein